MNTDNRYNTLCDLRTIGRLPSTDRAVALASVPTEKRRAMVEVAGCHTDRSLLKLAARLAENCNADIDYTRP